MSFYLYLYLYLYLYPYPYPYLYLYLYPYPYLYLYLYLYLSISLSRADISAETGFHAWRRSSSLNTHLLLAAAPPPSPASPEVTSLEKGKQTGNDVIPSLCHSLRRGSATSDITEERKKEENGVKFQNRKWRHY